jgi:hypothetical protein
MTILIEEALQEIGKGGPKEREKRIGEILSLPEEKVFRELLPYLDRGPFHLRNIAMEVLERIGPRGVSSLKPFLLHLTTNQKLFLSQIFLRWKTPAVIPILTTWIHDPDPNLKLSVCETLGEIGDPRGFTLIREVLERDPDPAVRGSALVAIARFPYEETKDLILRFLEEEREGREFTFLAIKRFGDPDLVLHLLPLLKEESEWIPLFLKHLGELLWEIEDEPLLDGFIPPEKFVKVAEETLRQEVDPGSLRIVSLFPSYTSLFPTLLEKYLTGEENPYLERTLGKYAGLRDLLLSLPPLNEFQELRFARLWIRHFPGDPHFLYRSLSHPHPLVRLEVLLHKGSGVEEDPTLLLSLLYDKDPSVRKVALKEILEFVTRERRYDLIFSLDLKELSEEVVEEIIHNLPEDALKEFQKIVERTFLARGKPHKAHLLLLSRTDEDQFLSNLQYALRKGEIELVLDLLPLLGEIPKKNVLNFLKDLLCSGPPTLSYPAGEILIRHPLLEEKDIEDLLFSLNDPPLLSPLIDWVQRNGSEEIRKKLLRLPYTGVEVEWGILKALFPLSGKEVSSRFEKALRSGHFVLELLALEYFFLMEGKEKMLERIPFVQERTREIFLKEYRSG